MMSEGAFCRTHSALGSECLLGYLVGLRGETPLGDRSARTISLSLYRENDGEMTVGRPEDSKEIGALS